MPCEACAQRQREVDELENSARHANEIYKKALTCLIHVYQVQLKNQVEEFQRTVHQHISDQVPIMENLIQEARDIAAGNQDLADKYTSVRTLIEEVVVKLQEADLRRQALLVAAEKAGLSRLNAARA